MHDTEVVVWHTMVINHSSRVTLEVVCHPLLYVLVEDLNVPVPIRARLLMVEAQRVTHLMSNDTFL